MGFQETFNERVTAASNRAFGVEVTMAHGAAVTGSFTAVWEDVNYEIDDAEGFATAFASRDFMFNVSDAVTTGGIAFEPRPGDRVRFTENGAAVEFELMPVGNLPAVELMPGGYRYRVRTKKAS